jgi:putative ABC transport system permease protein
MHRLRALWMRIRSYIDLGRRDDEFAAELESHVAMHTEDGIRAGLSPEEARRQALMRLGGAEQTRQAYRERHTLPWFENLLRDMRYALRGFRRNPIFTFTAIATLALGIGATTAVFSVVDRILFRSLPYAHSDRLVSVGMVHSLEKEEFTLGGYYFDWRDRQKPFEAMASQGTMLHACALVEANPQQLNCIQAQAGFLPLLGISPVLGRNFLPEEDKPHGPRVALISYGLWQDHYARDPAILDRMVDIDGDPARVVGVLPKRFELPTLEAPDVMMPLALDEGKERKAFPGSPMRTFARLRPGVNIAQAKAELDPVFDRTRDTFIPERLRNDIRLSVRSLRERETEGARPLAWLLLGSVVAVLLIACTNVAGLLVARGATRERELAVRSALGASQRRIIAQILVESTLLSAIGAVAGLILAAGLLRIFIAIAPTGIPFLNKASLDLRVASFAVLVSLLCGLLFGLLPAVEKPRAADLSSRGHNSKKTAVLRRSLVAGQIAISVVLLVGASLLLRSFQKMEEQNMGMQTHGVLTARPALPAFRYNTPQKKMEFYLQVEAALRRLPTVRAVGLSDSIPPGGWNSGGRISELVVEGRSQPAPGTGGPMVTRLITPDYFRALNIPIIRGRNFTEEDRRGSEYKMVLSRLLAARLFPGEDPIGKRMQLAPGGPWNTIVGVAENVKNNGLTGQDTPELYSLRRSTAIAWSVTSPVFLVDSASEPEIIAPWVLSQIRAIDPKVPVVTETLAQSVGTLAARPRFITALVGVFALCGLLMAAIGLYGVVAFLAAQRTQEIGVRVALGATHADVLRLIVGEGARLIAFGGIVGLAAAFAAMQLLKSLLFRVGTHDPASFIAVSLLLVLAAFTATLIPALTAMKIDPMVALRTE